MFIIRVFLSLLLIGCAAFIVILGYVSLEAMRVGLEPGTIVTAPEPLFWIDQIAGERLDRIISDIHLSQLIALTIALLLAIGCRVTTFLRLLIGAIPTAIIAIGYAAIVFALDMGMEWKLAAASVLVWYSLFGLISIGLTLLWVPNKARR